MIFWDTSAVLPLVLDEPATARVLALARRDPGIVVGWTTSVEALSALARRAREGHDARAIDEARAALRELAHRWDEVAPTDAVRGHAGRLLLRHPLRAADALQLGAALTWARGAPDGHGFACLDVRLAEAARAEGFDLPLG